MYICIYLHEFVVSGQVGRYKVARYWWAAKYVGRHIYRIGSGKAGMLLGISQYLIQVRQLYHTTIIPIRINRY